MSQHGVGIDTKIDQAGNLVNTRLPELACHDGAPLGCAKQAAYGVITRKSVLQQRIHVFRR